MIIEYRLVRLRGPEEIIRLDFKGTIRQAMYLKRTLTFLSKLGKEEAHRRRTRRGYSRNYEFCKMLEEQIVVYLSELFPEE